MILRRLAEYYDTCLETGNTANLPRRGFSVQKIGFCVVLNLDGSLNSFASLLDEKARPQGLLVPGATKPSGSGINPGFLWDNAAYMLAFEADEKKKARAARCFEAFRNRHLSLEDTLNHPAFTAVCTFLRQWSCGEAALRSAELNDACKSFGVFRLAGETRFVHEIVPPPPDQTPAATAAGAPAICLVTGRPTPRVARLHEPKIKGVRGSQSAGALLVSFNDPAYNSYGKEQSYNAPVSEDAAFKYTNALNKLLSERRLSLGDATVTYWADRPNPLENFISDLLGDAPPAGSLGEDLERVRQSRLFLSQLRDGTCCSDSPDGRSHTRFYILALSPNQARIAVRFWIESDVESLQQHLGQHLRDIDLVDPYRDSPPSIRDLVNATGRAKFEHNRFKGFEIETVSPLLAGTVARAVLTGSAYPQTLLAATLRRIRSDGEIHPTRCAAIRACLVRNSRLRGNPLEVPVALDQNNPDPAYNAGRLFALLEKLQTDSAGAELNASIRDRYFSSASSTPAIAFPVLMRLHNFHLRKLENPGRRVYYDKLIGGVISRLAAFPVRLSLEQQGLFTIGYYHQRQDLFTKKSEPKGDA